jgi:hypothetical protein
MVQTEGKTKKKLKRRKDGRCWKRAKGTGREWWERARKQPMKMMPPMSSSPSFLNLMMWMTMEERKKGVVMMSGGWRRERTSLSRMHQMSATRERHRMTLAPLSQSVVVAAAVILVAAVAAVVAAAVAAVAVADVEEVRCTVVVDRPEIAAAAAVVERAGR